MKIYTSNYRNHWLSPYTILEKFFFWRKDIYDREPPNWLQTLCEWNQNFLNFVHPRINYIKIDPWDVWSMDTTLAPIILPMLKKLKEEKQGSPFIDDEDVPDHLKSMNAPRVETEWDTDENFHKRWEWVLNEEIFAFESLVTDWEDQFRTGEHDLDIVKGENGLSQIIRGPKDTYKCDYDGMREYQKRIDNGFRLFGKFFRHHWD